MQVQKREGGKKKREGAGTKRTNERTKRTNETNERNETKIKRNERTNERTNEPNRTEPKRNETNEVEQTNERMKICRGPGLGRVEFYNDNIGGPGVGISSPWFRIPRFASPPLPGRCTNGEKSQNELQTSYGPENLTI